MSEAGDAGQGDKPIQEQAREQTGQRQIRVGMDERNMKTSYANAFRTNATAEEVMLDFGLNVVNPAREQEGQPDIIFQVNERVILNHYPTARGAVRRTRARRQQTSQRGLIVHLSAGTFSDVRTP